MRRMLLIGFLLAVGAAGSTPAPNILFILADDLGYGDVSCYGRPDFRTPAIDRIAERGVRFTQAYANAAVCSPTRVGLMTGRYQTRFGHETNAGADGQGLPLTETTIANRLKAAGYATGAFGKWHNGSQWPYHPMARGFDEYFGHTSGHWGEYFDAPLEELRAALASPFDLDPRFDSLRAAQDDHPVPPDPQPAAAQRPHDVRRRQRRSGPARSRRSWARPAVDCSSRRTRMDLRPN